MSLPMPPEAVPGQASVPPGPVTTSLGHLGDAPMQVAESMEFGAAQRPPPPAIQAKPPLQPPGPPAASQQPPVTPERLPPPQNQVTPPQSQTPVSQSLVHIPQAHAVHFPGPTVAGPSTLPPAGGQPQVGVVSGVDILRELQRLASRVDSVMFEVSQVKQVQFTLESLIRSSANARKAGTAPKKRPRKKGAKGKEKGSDAQPPAVLVPINEHFGGAETDEADNLYDWPPVKTVEECWREMYEGLDGRPSLMALEEQYASGWRRRKGQRQRFCEKKQVCEYVKHLAVENRCSHQAAIQHLANKKESLCKLLLRLRQYKKSAREMEAQVAANTMQVGGQGVPQQGMHAGLQNGMQAAMPVGMHSGMQAGMHGGTQPGMHPEGQSGAQNGVEGGPVQPAGPSELVEAMHDGLPTEMQAGMQNGVPSGAQDHPQG